MLPRFLQHMSGPAATVILNRPPKVQKIPVDDDEKQLVETSTVTTATPIGESSSSGDDDKEEELKRKKEERELKEKEEREEREEREKREKEEREEKEKEEKRRREKETEERKKDKEKEELEAKRKKEREEKEEKEKREREEKEERDRRHKEDSEKRSAEKKEKREAREKKEREEDEEEARLEREEEAEDERNHVPMALRRHRHHRKRHHKKRVEREPEEDNDEDDEDEGDSDSSSDSHHHRHHCKKCRCKKHKSGGGGGGESDGGGDEGDIEAGGKTIHVVVKATGSSDDKDKDGGDKEEDECGKDKTSHCHLHDDMSPCDQEALNGPSDSSSSDPVIAEKKKEYVSLTKGIKANEIEFAKEADWLTKALTLINELKQKTHNVQLHLNDIHRDMSLMEGKRQKAAKELAEAEKRKNQEQGLHKLEKQLDALMAASTYANEKISTLTQRKAQYLAKIGEVRNMLQGIKLRNMMANPSAFQSLAENFGSSPQAHVAAPSQGVSGGGGEMDVIPQFECMCSLPAPQRPSIPNCSCGD